MSNLKYIHSPHATINSPFINLPFLSTVLLVHVRDALGCACEGRASKEKRMAAYKMLSWMNCWNRVLYQRDIFLTKTTVRRVLITLPHFLGSEVLCDEVRVVNMGARDEKPMNSSLVW